MARVPVRHDVRRNILGDDRPRADHAVLADGDAGQDRHVRADPRTAADGDRQRVLGDGRRLTQVGTDRVSGGHNRHVRADHHVVADGHDPVIDQRQVEVRVKPRADERVAPPVRVQRWFDIRALADAAEQSLQEGGAAAGLARAGGVEVVEQFQLGTLGVEHLLVVAQIDIAGLHDVQHSLRHRHGNLLVSGIAPHPTARGGVPSGAAGSPAADSRHGAGII